MLPPGFEDWPSKEKAEFFKYHPGMAIAHEVDDMLAGTTPPLKEEDVAAATPLISQALQATTPVPGFIWSKVIRRMAKFVPAGPIRIAAIIAAIGLPYLLYLNGTALADSLIAHGLFSVIDWIKIQFM